MRIDGSGRRAKGEGSSEGLRCITHAIYSYAGLACSDLHLWNITERNMPSVFVELIPQAPCWPREALLQVVLHDKGWQLGARKMSLRH